MNTMVAGPGLEISEYLIKRNFESLNKFIILCNLTFYPCSASIMPVKLNGPTARLHKNSAENPLAQLHHMVFFFMLQWLNKLITPITTFITKLIIKGDS